MSKCTKDSGELLWRVEHEGFPCDLCAFFACLAVKYFYPTHDLCHNWSIVWTKEMISAFLHKLNPIGMTYSPNVEWSLDVLESFPNLWWYDELPYNSTCWNRVFPAYNHREYMLPLLDELLRREGCVLKFDF